MTETQKQRIQTLRGKGESYGSIATMLGISENTVKSYCKRNNLGGRLAVTSIYETTTDACKQCGKPLRHIKGRKPQKFCSASCRTTWWAAHPHEIKRKAIYSFVCAECDTAFSAYGNADRKYCSHACYVRARFGGDT